MLLFSSVILQVKDTDINDSMHYLYFRCVCVGGEVKSISVLHDAQLGVTQSPTYKDLSEILYLVAGTQSWIEFWSSIISPNFLKF